MPHRTPYSQQLDLFIHSNTVILANDTIEALLRRDCVRAADCLRHLIAEEPDYRNLGALRTLCRTLQEWPFPATDRVEITEAVRRLETDVQAAADAVMHTEAKDFMAPFWRDLANAANHHAYDADFPQAFSAHLYLRCGDHSAAAKAAESVPNSNDNPDALYWLALAQYRVAGLDACLHSLVRLALLAPKRLSRIVAEINDPGLRRDWDAFQDECAWLDPADETADSWFPAWYLVEHSDTRLAPDMPSLKPTTPQRAYALVVRLIQLEKRGYSKALVAERRQLLDLAPELFALYMARRDT